MSSHSQFVTADGSFNCVPTPSTSGGADEPSLSSSSSADGFKWSANTNHIYSQPMSNLNNSFLQSHVDKMTKVAAPSAVGVPLHHMSHPPAASFSPGLNPNRAPFVPRFNHSTPQSHPQHLLNSECLYLSILTYVDHFILYCLRLC